MKATRTTSSRSILLGAMAGAALVAALSGCGTTPSGSPQAQGANVAVPQDQTVKTAGTLLLSVNPEIEVEYDDEGLVTEVEGVNDEGRGVVSDYAGYEGREARDVVSDLVGEIYRDGYFDQTVDGHDRNVVVKLEQGSSYPGDDFLRGIEDDVRAKVGTFGLASDALAVAPDQLDERGYIGLDAAKDIVLAQLGLSEASFNDHEYELDDGVYELEFSANGVEYEYEVDARSGKVLEADVDGNDDWDGRDDWDDWNDDRYDRDDWDDDHDDDRDDDWDDWDDDHDDHDDDRDDWDDDHDDRDDWDD